MSRKKKEGDFELEIGPFMNILIVLVPILLMNMTISATTILNLKLPAGAGGGGDGASENQQVELIIHSDYMVLNYPAGQLISEFPNKDKGVYDFKGLSQKLQVLKPAIEESIGKDKRDILILSESKTDYQTLVTAMDTVRSYKTVVVTDVVEAELFPDISLGDAPEFAGGGVTK